MLDFLARGAVMARWIRIVIATAVPLAAGGLAWWLCAREGLDLDTTGIVVGLVVLLPATPLGIWAGQDPARSRTSEAPVLDLADRTVARAESAPAVVGDVPREPKAFQPRPGLRERIEEIFADGAAAVVCSLAGARGVGKTHLAAAYARARIDEGVPVAWLNAETPEQLRGGLDVLARELGLWAEGDNQGAVARKVKAWLGERREPYLVVFDNAVDPDVIAPLLPAHGHARVLITTNDHAFERVADLVSVDRFSVKEALAYLRERVGPGDASGARRLIEELDRVPLALSVAAASLVGPPRQTYDDYLLRLRGTPIDELLARPAGEPYPRGIAQAILLSVGEVDAAGVRLLGELSVLSPSGVGRELLGADQEETLAELGTKSLITFSRDGSTVIVHRLVQRVMRERAVREANLVDLVHGATRYLTLVGEIPREDTWRRLPLILAVADHSHDLWKHLEPRLADVSRDTAEAVLSVRHAVGYHLNELTDGGRAAPIHEEVVAASMGVLGADHPSTLSARHSLALAYRSAGRVAEAVEVLERLVADNERLLGLDDPRTISARHSLALAYRSTRRAPEAVGLLERVVADRRRVLGADDPSTLSARHSLAVAYRSVGRTAEAVELLEQVVADRRRVLGTDHLSTLAARHGLAVAYASAGKQDAALTLFTRVLGERERVLGADHPDTLNSRYSLGQIHESQGRRAEALEHYERVLAGREAVLGAEHPETRRTRSKIRRLTTQ